MINPCSRLFALTGTAAISILLGENGVCEYKEALKLTAKISAAIILAGFCLRNFFNSLFNFIFLRIGSRRNEREIREIFFFGIIIFAKIFVSERQV